MLNLDGMAADSSQQLVEFEMFTCTRMPAKHFSISTTYCSHANEYMQVISAHPAAS